MEQLKNLKIAIGIPCYNEALTICDVINKFKLSKYVNQIIVIDNNSTDDTINQAKTTDAIILIEKQKGKGHAVKKFFSTVNADIYIIIDGDDTYDALQIDLMLEKFITEQADMLIANRIQTCDNAYPLFHKIGNFCFNLLVTVLFWNKINDIFSGYRIFNKHFINSITIESKEFEIEAELTIKAIQNNMKIIEYKSNYTSRVSGSFSKLNTFIDGWKILFTIVKMFFKKNK